MEGGRGEYFQKLRRGIGGGALPRPERQEVVVHVLVQDPGHGRARSADAPGGRARDVRGALGVPARATAAVLGDPPLAPSP